MKDKKNIFITIGVITLIIIILVINILETPKTKETTNQTKPQKENVVQDYSKLDALFAFSGTYVKDQYLIVMNISSKKTIDLTITDGKNFSTITLELDSNNYLVNQEELIEVEKVNIKIAKTKEGIDLTASSKIEESIFYELSGVFKTEKINDNNWSGYYTYKDTSIIIDEYGDGLIYLYIDSINYTNYIDKYEKGKIILEEKFPEGTEKVTIEKTKDGIKLSSNKQGSKYIFGNISGEYKKQH